MTAKAVLRAQAVTSSRESHITYCEASETAKSRVLRRLIRSVQESSRLPSIVELICQRCNATAMQHIKQDIKPQWTKGEPPKYIEKLRKCRQCEGLRRWIPLDPKIPSIPWLDLRKFEKRFGYMNDNYIVSVLTARTVNKNLSDV
jgi:hypothetical protein